MGLVVLVEGLIGAGKSTFTTELGQALGDSTLVLMEPDEQGDANPYLADFYGDKARWSFTMQAHLLGMRYRMQLAAQWHAMSGRGHAVCDRSYYGDTCFARMMHRSGEITDREFETYRVLYQAMSASVLLPSVCVRLLVPPEVAANRIRRRAEARVGRRAELAIDLNYLEALDKEITTTAQLLHEQGVQLLMVPWGDDLPVAEERRAMIQTVADQIRNTAPKDLFQLHHRRVTT